MMYTCMNARRDLERANEMVELYYPYTRRFGIDCTHYDADGDYVDLMTPKECAEYTAFYNLLEERVKMKKEVVDACALVQ